MTSHAYSANGSGGAIRTGSTRLDADLAAIFSPQPGLPVGLHAAAMAVLNNRMSRPDHVLIFADALNELAREQRLVDAHDVAAEVDCLILRLQAAAPLLA